MVGAMLPASCQKVPAAASAPQTAPAAVVAPPASPAPPPPRCESLQENCIANAGTRVAVGPKRTTFAVPTGWKYAASAERATAVHPEGVGLLVVSYAASVDDAAVGSAIEREALGSAIQDFSWADLKRRWKKADAELPFGAGKVDLWEVDAKRQRGRAPKLRDVGPGTLLVGVARRATDEPIVALGFVLDSGKESDAPKLVMDALGSLEGAPP